MISYSDHHDVSDEPLALRRLTDQQQDRLGELLESYMTALETGLPPSIQSLTETCPELGDALRSCVSGLETLHRMAGGDSLVASSETDEANMLGGFKLHEEIGRGGMGVVYRATQVSLRRTVALKVLPLASMLDSQKLMRFQHEAEAAASLQHPNIVPVFAVGCERGTHYYAMQYIDGVSLADGVSQAERGIGLRPGDSESTQVVSQHRVDWRTTVTQAVDVSKGLHAAHELGIIHRDIKPSNLLVDHDGKVWITDFGLARIQNDVSLTQSGDVIGTMRYMSPEQTRGDSALVDGRADVYSLGVTLYEVLTGVPAHDGEDAPAIVRQIDEDAVVPLRSLRTDLPRDLDTVVAKAMSKRRDDRYETAKAFAEDLERVLAGQPTIARPPTLLDHCVRLAVAYQAFAATAVLIGLLIIAGFAIGTVMLTAEKRVSDANAAAARNNESIAREAIDRLGMQVAELLDDIPAASTVRHRLLLQTLDYYQRLAAQSDALETPNREQRLDLAITHGKIGSFQSELGLHGDALASLTKSEQLFADLAAAYPYDMSLQLQWSVSENNLAERFVRSGDFETATHWFGNAITIQKRLQSTGVEFATKELATTLNNLGQMLTQSENFEQAETVFGRAIELLDGNETLASLQSTIQSNLAGLLVKTDPLRASGLARATLAYQVQQLELDRSDVAAATQVIVTLNTLATAQAAQSQHRAAIESLQQAIAVSEQLLTRWPNQLTYRRDLGISLNYLGLSLSATGQTDKARDAFQRASQHAHLLVDAFTGDPEVHSMLGGILNNLGFLNQRLGDRNSAREHYADAIKHQQVAVELAPQVSRYQIFLKKHRHNLDQLRGES